MPPIRSWRFTALEFRTLWEVTGRDVLPYPLRQESTEPDSDAARSRRQAAENLAPQLDSELEHAVRVLLAPQARVEVAGFADRTRTAGAHGAVLDRFAALAVQQPGPDGTGGEVALSLLAADDLAEAALGALPRREAGTGAPIAVTATELDEPRPPTRDPWRPTSREQFEQFFTRPMDAIHHLAVYPYGSIDNRHTEGRDDFQLHDVTDDGRYVVYGSRTITVKPAAPHRVAKTLSAIITETVTATRDGTYLPH
ncbi:ESX secretion-associated protein EspG [Nocardia sp. NPDC058176]|uniref:ESX secretion-associated protein EspG n=1 Tax=Nocardia sp. NPDC058176 TaxID=3346368 RepID=UPI0036DC515F